LKILLQVAHCSLLCGFSCLLPPSPLTPLPHNCSQHNGKSYASFRVGVRYNNTLDTRVRDDLWVGVGSVSLATPCNGGYDDVLYSNVAALFAEHELTVSQNGKWRLLNRQLW
jgi:hypothetical protein